MKHPTASPPSVTPPVAERYVTSTAADGVYLISEGDERRLIATVKAPREVADKMAAAEAFYAALTRIAWLRPAGDVEAAKNARALVEEIEKIALAALSPGIKL